MKTVPWAGRRHAFAGWVPNVHSHLSFSLAGLGRGPEVSPMAPAYTGRLRRLVCVLQRRETDDFLAPAWWSRKHRPAATQHFLMVGATEEVQTPVGFKTVVAPPTGRLVDRIVGHLAGDARDTMVRVATALDEQGMLRGRVHVMFWQAEEADAARQRALIERLRSLILAGGRPAGSEGSGPTDGELDVIPEALAQEIRRDSRNAVPLEFALFRTGEIRIWYDDAVANNLGDEVRVDLARQSYFFVKDMVHHHVHHDAKSDQITPLTEIGQQDTEAGEEHWRRQTVWSLSRVVDALARRGKLQDLREATGILAYADAFQKTLLLYRRRDEDQTSFEPNSAAYRYDYAHIRESLKVQIDQVTARRTTLSQLILAWLAGSIAGTSLLASVISAHNGALKEKIVKVAPILPGVPHDLLGLLARLPLLPALVCGWFLWLVSQQVLSEDRIGFEQQASRKGLQFVRGSVNSLARRKPVRDGAWVQRWIERFYLLIVALLLFAMLLLAPLAGELGRKADLFIARVWHWQQNAPGSGERANGADGGAVRDQRGRSHPAAGASLPPNATLPSAIKPAASTQPTQPLTSGRRGRPPERGR